MEQLPFRKRLGAAGDNVRLESCFTHPVQGQSVFPCGDAAAERSPGLGNDGCGCTKADCFSIQGSVFAKCCCFQSGGSGVKEVKFQTES